MTTKMTMEQRVAALENTIARMEARRARFVPKEVDEDENIILLMQDRFKNQVNTWKSCLAADGVQIAEARQREMAAQALKELEAQGKSENQRLAAEVLAVIQYYEKHRELPEGCDYEIIDDSMTPINTKMF